MNTGDRTTVSLGERFRALRESTGMNRKEFAAWLDIPYRTMQDWEINRSVMPNYVFALIEYKVKNEFGLEKNQLQGTHTKSLQSESVRDKRARQSKESVIKKLKDCVKILEEDKTSQTHMKCSVNER